MDFNVKKMVKDAGAALSRAIQLTEEKLGTSEKTELDAYFENLWSRAENTKNFTEKIVKNTEAVLIPNPGNRIEDYIYEKIEKQRPSRLSNLEYLGMDMVEAGTVLGPGTAYGSSLIKVGQWEQKLGQTERDFIGSAGMCFTQPLRKFLETEMKTIIKEKNLLEVKRLDLDACKNRVRKARSMLGQPTAERELRIAQSEFDRQTEITKLLLEGVGSSHAAHLRYLYEFVETQARFYSQCTTIMTDLQRELTSLSSSPSVSPTQNNTIPDDMKKAKSIYDYTAKDSTELSLKANEVIYIKEIQNSDYYLGKNSKNNQGLVPKAYLEVIT
ncbi:endophilin-B1 isoform X2 [Diorhabda carinulata]|uniref:endophilin-B1 isoform X2 n=1 Tax=Diorhabda sublineata TaxID=1163346 RepID=UPI0024E1199C|nr:endophilin-B1 isoform X2 [Diorhabda sublineata]XP_057663034.1 endophilin-B1 isoform X2 [Diorhabda carinulata]